MGGDGLMWVGEGGWIEEGGGGGFVGHGARETSGRREEGKIRVDFVHSTLRY